MERKNEAGEFAVKRYFVCEFPAVDDWEKFEEEMVKLELNDLLWRESKEIALRYFDFKDVDGYEPPKRFYCFTCDKELTSKEARRHRRRGHEVVRIAEPKSIPKEYETAKEMEFWNRPHGKGQYQGYEFPKCHYCGREEKPFYPLTQKIIGRDENDKPIVVKVCPICLYRLFGKRSLSGRGDLRDKNAIILKIQRNYVYSLKAQNPEELARIHQQLREWIKSEIEQKLRAKGLREPDYTRELERRLKTRIAKALIHA